MSSRLPRLPLGPNNPQPPHVVAAMIIIAVVNASGSVTDRVILILAVTPILAFMMWEVRD